tara:strand:- start:46234 stop:46959 length:726 start_codon:yes stop_codon:yes gene_type:complete
MKTFLNSAFALILVMINPLSHTDAADEQSTETLNAQHQVNMNYLLYVPESAETDPPLPLVLFLHGAGERGNDLELVKKHGPPKLVAAGKSFPFILVSPQCVNDRWWEPTELTVLLDHIVSQHNVDTNRVYVTGLSMGGFGTWRLAAYTPDRFAAIAPVCGGGEPFWAKLIKDIPAWVLHGAKDKAVPLERSEEMVNAIKKAGGNPKFTIYPDAEHDSWTETYDNPEFYQWLLAQTRKSDAE